MLMLGALCGCLLRRAVACCLVLVLVPVKVDQRHLRCRFDGAGCRFCCPSEVTSGVGVGAGAGLNLMLPCAGDSAG